MLTECSKKMEGIYFQLCKTHVMYKRGQYLPASVCNVCMFAYEYKALQDITFAFTY